MQRDTSDIIVIRFNEDFATTLPTDSVKAQLEQMVLQDIVKKHPNIVVIDSSVTQGKLPGPPQVKKCFQTCAKCAGPSCSKRC